MAARKLQCVIAVLALCLAFGAPVQAQTFTLKGVAFDQSAYFPEDELLNVAKPYLNRPIGFEDLTAMLASIQALYSKAGIVTAQAILPPQTLENGVLRIALIEARIDAFEIEGLDRTSPEFLRRTISLAPGELPDFEAIERDLRIYQLSHDISPKIAFKPGREPGTTIAIISGEEAKPLSFTFSLDNFGR